MSVILIPKANEDRTNFPCWRGASNSEGNKLSPIVYCACGKPMGIQSHQVSSDGTVTPSFWHRDDLVEGDNKGCGWHEHIKLENF